jgi:hypothetical protein
MAKGTAGPLPKTAAAPRTTGSINPAAKTTATTTGQKQAAGAQAANDPVGDICLLPDIARFAH